MISAAEQMNQLSATGIPFIFVIDFDLCAPVVLPLMDVHPDQILFDFNGITNAPSFRADPSPVRLRKHPIAYEMYKDQFDKVKQEIQSGNSYLLNLTCSTPVDINLSLKDIFYRSRAKYKLWYRDAWVVFSPETFIKIDGSTVSTFPMKGTIDASLPGAHESILNDPKETAEHTTIVDLMRNDLSIIARGVRVKRFRYIDEIKTSDKNLLQVSSEITGELPSDFRNNLGDILLRLLPAGSISGAPKEKTVKIIRSSETHQRGYFTGVCGYVDGHRLDSGVMIRFMERSGEQLIYKSGGGITFMSDPVTEYREMTDKVYVPII